MNKTININLGGYALTIDEDAYEIADHYLTTLARHFGTGEGAGEIMQDIESRMGELVNRHKGTRIIVSKDDVVQAITVLGTPEELKDMDFAEIRSKKKEKTGESFQIKTGKRLYRDPDDKVVSGVCSGLAAYFGIQDAVWVRVAFALLALGWGTGVILYLILAAIVPPARTVSERLEMMGEPTNVNNIAKAVKDELEELGDKLNEQFNKKKKKKRPAAPGDDEPHMAGWPFGREKSADPQPGGNYNKKDFV